MFIQALIQEIGPLSMLRSGMSLASWLTHFDMRGCKQWLKALTVVILFIHFDLTLIYVF